MDWHNIEMVVCEFCGEEHLEMVSAMMSIDFIVQEKTTTIQVKTVCPSCVTKYLEFDPNLE